MITPVRDRTCSTCGHEGCCTYPCGGHNWSAAYVECANCGDVIYRDCSITIDGADYCERCAETIDNEEED